MPPLLCWLLSALAIGGSLVWIAVGEDKGTAIFSGIVAVGIARVLIGDVARWHEERAAAERREDGDGADGEDDSPAA